MGYLILIIFLSALFIGFFYSKNKALNVAIIFLMWILMAFSSKTADFNIYTRRLENPDSESLEPLFYAFVKILNKLGIGIQGFIFIIGTIYIVVIYKLLIKNRFVARRAGYILALYCIYPFCIDISQLRNTLGFVPILYYFSKTIKDQNTIYKNESNDDLFLAICILISTLIHYSGIFYIVLLVAKKIKIKKTVLVTVIFLGVASLIGNFSVYLLNFSKYFGENLYNKVWTVFNNSILQQQDTIVGTMRMMIVTFVIVMLFLLIEYKKNKDPYIEYAIKVNILLLNIIPLVAYAVDLFRVQRCLLILSYIVFSRYITSKSEDLSRLNIRVLLYKFGTLVVPLFGLYVNIIRSDVVEGVILPLIKSNLLF